MTLRTLWIAATFSLVAGCSSDTVTVAVPDLIGYSADFQSRAADQLRPLDPPCHRQSPSTACSAIRTLIEDYYWTRERIRAAE